MSLEIWNRVCTPPPKVLTSIGGGRMKGMTSINPQWRFQVMTEVFGLVGVGWNFRVTKQWTHTDTLGQEALFVEVALKVLVNEEWSEDIYGVGGSMLIASESAGLRLSDEAYKMATTDALSVAMKQLGVGADIYLGNFSNADSKYTINYFNLIDLIEEAGADSNKICNKYGVKNVDAIPQKEIPNIIAMLKKKIDEKNKSVPMEFDTTKNGDK